VRSVVSGIGCKLLLRPRGCGTEGRSAAADSAHLDECAETARLP
jgi:hypothetical protein